ncbi:trigger factor [Sandarakinorhabdus cyanobacteriorum]|uniref:Trigger factor n=1 Tax=Sandarakinorhabdus cyanobacteriorum TaxID=1981098 RepID=A0A255YGI6_9SPHN|nr:trigger factor [Sandarakinorhabdus cyanobacteriorum]OYQ28283.1 trigger factor [Sandarakinorhabdus cyanobacteriorum]
MQIAEITNQGLRRAYSLVIPAEAIAARVETRLAEVSKTIRMPGFRPGKVPANLVKKMHGAALRGEALQDALNDGVNQVISSNGLRPATQPQVDVDGELPDDGDARFTVSLEILPTIDDVKIDDLALEKLVVPADDAAMDAALARLAESAQRTEPAPAKHKAKTGDTVVIDYEGTVDGVKFDGGTGEGMRVKIGSGQLIPGFEDQLVGAKANEQRTILVTFPEDYGAANLAGKPAEFAITVQAVEVPAETKIDDEFAKGFGLDSLDALKEILKDQLDAELGGLSRTHLKRKLLDTLASRHDFDVPVSMVDAEFDQIWQTLEAEAAREADPAAAKAEIEAEREDYRRIAVRRVRLGLLLSEIGQRGGVTVSQAEMNRLIGQEAARYAPAEQQKVVKFFQENAMAAMQLRAPLYEDKVVDYLIGKAAITERAVTREELEAAIASEDESPAGHVHGPDCEHDHDHAPAKPAKKAAAKKAKAEEPAAEAAAEPVKKAPAKKAAAKKADAEPAAEAEAPAKPKKATKKSA